MRVRYGKPIKVKNVSDVTESFSISSSNRLLSGCGGQSISSTHKSYLYQQMASRVGHKIFMLYKLNSTTLPPITDVMRLIVVRANGSSVICSTNGAIDTYKTDNDYYGNMTVGTGTTTNPETADTWLQLNSGLTFDAGTSYSWFIIDLTEAFGSGKEPTAQEFYNKYNKYFPLIATGEEITIDDKAGQVSLKKLLPNEYQEVEYIESNSTGNQRIDTGINASSTLGLSYKINEASGRFGVLGADDSKRHHSYDTTALYGYASGGYGTASLGEDTEVKVNWFNDRKLYKNGTKVADLWTGNFDAEMTYILFARNYRTRSNFSPYWKGKLYYFKMTIGTELVRNFIPCYRKSDNVIGLYDTIGQQFYTNQGTGTFLKGNNVNNTISYKVAGGSSDIYYGYNQLVENGQFENGTDRWFMQNGTFSVANDIATFTQTDLSVGYTRLTQKLTKSTITGHKYFVHFYGKHNLSIDVNLRENSHYNTNSFIVPPNVWTLCETISLANAGTGYATISTRNAELNNTKCDVDVRDYMLIDLTDWFGTGKEPTTVQEFKEKFTKDYYGFCPTPIKLTEKLINALPVYGYNQLIENGDFSNGVNKWYRNSTYTSLTNEDGIGVLTITSSGATTTQINLYTSNNNLQAEVGHKYFSSYTIKSNVNTAYEDQLFGGSRDYVSTTVNNVNQNWSTRERILTAINTNGWQIYLAGNYSVGNKYYFKNIQIIDLTDWYGAGNEPTTVEEFKQTFPNKYYPYSKKRLLNKYMINKLVN